MTNKSRRGLAYHEAGHAIVASALGLRVIKVQIGTEDDPSAGKTCIDPDASLCLTDGLAVCLAGKAAEELFDTPAHARAWHLDRLRADQLLEQVSEDFRTAQKHAGYQRARSILEAHNLHVTQLADYLIQHAAADQNGGLDLLPRRA
jgi:hypothetical protein